MDKARFFAQIRKAGPALFGVSLSQKQVDGLNAILDAAVPYDIPLKQLAYILATAFHETAHTMQPIEEYGKGRGRPYGRAISPYMKIYYGRGYVMITWLSNYKKASQEIGEDFVKYPEKALEPKLAARIMFEGMLEGWFTGKKLSDYIDGVKCDYINARRIINGTDRAAVIAGYAIQFEWALKAGEYGMVRVPVRPPPAPVAPAPAAKFNWLLMLVNIIIGMVRR